MQKIKICGLFFVIILLYSRFNSGFSEENLTLETIVIAKGKVHLINSYLVDYEAFKNKPFNSAIEALSLLPLDLQSRSPRCAMQTDFSLRGSNFQGVLMLIDGQRINDPQTAHHNCDIPITVEDVERIEIIPGVSSSLFGPDAIGGAVNIVIKRPEEKKGVLVLGAGQYQTKSGLISITDKFDNLGVRLSLENQESRGFYEDTDYKKSTATVNSSLDFSNGSFNTHLGYQEKEFGAYDFYTPKSGYLSKEWTKTYLLSAAFNLNRDGFIIKPNFLWRRHYDKFMLDKTQIRSRYFNHHRTDIYTPGVYLQGELGLLGRVGVGFEYGQEIINSTNLGKHHRYHKSLFMDESKDLSEDLSLGLSFRLDDLAGSDIICTGSFGIKYIFSRELLFNLGLSRSMRNPSFTELYYNDPTTQGSADLSSEKSLGCQAGYSYEKENLSSGATLFLRKDEDFVDWIKHSNTQAKWQAENLGEAEVLGVEKYLRYNINQDLVINLNYTYIDRRISKQGHLFKYGHNYARHLFNATFNLELPVGGQSLEFSYKKKPGRDGWFLLNTYLSYNLRKNSQIFLSITNIFNVEYQEIEGIPQPGRWIEGGLRFEW